MLCVVRNEMKLTFSQWFLLKRREKALTQDEIANALSVSKQTISNWERAVSVPTLSINQIKKLCELLECDLKDIPSYGD